MGASRVCQGPMSAASTGNGSTTAPSPGRPDSLIWKCFAPRGHSRKRRNAIGTSRAMDRSGLSMTCTCTCGWVELPELPHSAIGCPAVTFCRSPCEWSRPQMHKGDERAAVAHCDDQIVAGDRTHSLPEPRHLAQRVGHQGQR